MDGDERGSAGRAETPTFLSTHQALLRLIELLSRQQVEPASASDNQAIASAAAAALQEARAPGAGAGARTGAALPPIATALDTVFRHFSYQPGVGFALPLDARRLATRLRSLLYSGMRFCGGGTYSQCFRATFLPNGRPVVLKRLRIEVGEEGVPSVALRELSLMRALEGSGHIVQLLDVLHDPHARPAGGQACMYLVLESLDRDLRAHLDLEPAAARQLPFIKSAMYQVLSALAYAHTRNVMHRDLKPHNILLDQRTGTVKVGDWGLARTTTPGAPRPHTQEVQTLLYRAPELLLGANIYSLSIDMWSCGCILAELATGVPLFMADTDTQIGVLLAMFQLLGTPDEEQWPGVSCLPDWCPQFPRFRARGLAQAAPQLGPQGLELLSRMLCYNPARRITARQALAHPWFNSVRAVEQARGSAALLAAQQLQQEMQLPQQPRAARGDTAAAAAGVAAGAGSPGDAGGGGQPYTPAAMRGHLLSWEGSVSPGEQLLP